MSTHSRNWLKFTAAIAFTTMLVVGFARLFDLPALGMAQASKSQGAGQHAAITPVSAPHLADMSTLSALSDAYAQVTAAVRPSVVFIKADQPAPEEMFSQLPPGFQIPQVNPNDPRGNGNGTGNGGGGGRRQQQTPPATRVHPPVMESSIGSGFVVSNDGYILTNNHVIEGATKIQVRLLDDRVFTATLVGADKSTDIAVLKIDAKGLTPAALGSSEKVRVGEWVLAIGNPLGDNLTFSVTQGIVSAKGRGIPLDQTEASRFNIQDFIQTDAAINQGNSGGPLINVRGEVIGINSAIASTTGSYQGYAFAVPIDLATQVMNQIITHGKFERSVLQVSVQTADADDAAYLGLPTIGGVRVESFPSDNSPAKIAGILPGDVIVAIDGKPVTYTAQLQQIVGFHHPGDALKVEVARKAGHKEFTVKVVAADIPATETKAAAGPNANEPTPVVAKNKLGVLVEPVTPALATQLHLPAGTQGLYIDDFATGAPADEKLNSKAANRFGSVILEVEGKAVHNEDELKASLADAKNGVVTLTVVGSVSGNPAVVVPAIVRVRLMQP